MEYQQDNSNSFHSSSLASALFASGENLSSKAIADLIKSLLVCQSNVYSNITKLSNAIILDTAQKSWEEYLLWDKAVEHKGDLKSLMISVNM